MLWFQIRRYANCKEHNRIQHTIMKDLKMNGTWNEVKGKLKQKYAQLTDDDLILLDGKADELYGRLQKRLGKTLEEIRKEVVGY